MNKKSHSLRWRIFLSIMIILTASLAFTGFIVGEKFEKSHYDLIMENNSNLAAAVQNGMELSKYSSLETGDSEVKGLLSDWDTGSEQEIYIVGPSLFVLSASNMSEAGKKADFLDKSLIKKALKGAAADRITLKENGLTIMDSAFPVKSDEDAVTGVIFIRKDVSDVNNIVVYIKRLFLQIALIAAAAALLLALFAAVSITRPIDRLSVQAQRMAEGNFSETIEVKSNDEIGQLSQMFNSMGVQLDRQIEEITTEKSKLETILGNMADGLIATDMKGNIIHINAAAASLLGITEEEAVESGMVEILARLGRLDEINNIDKDNPMGVVSKEVDYDGRHLSIRYVSFTNDSEKYSGVILLIEDVTERHRLDMMQKDFVANVSHELRTPITTIRSYTETMLYEDFDNEMKNRFLEVIYDESDRMTHLVTDLLQLSKLDANREKMKPVRMSVRELLAGCIEKVRILAEAKNQEVAGDFGDREDAEISADKGMIHQVLINVLTNAIKYTPEEGRIAVDFRIEEEKVFILISDNGIGISRDNISRVFERFYRVDKARSRAMGGTGLGLAIAKNIVEAHNGVISIDSVEGIGTRVDIELPLADSGRALKVPDEEEFSEENV